MINPGISTKISEKISVALSISQQSDLPLAVQFGGEYFYQSALFLRFGFHSVPVSETFGFGLKIKNLNLDAAIQTHSQLGNSTSIALTFLL